MNTPQDLGLVVAFPGSAELGCAIVNVWMTSEGKVLAVRWGFTRMPKPDDKAIINKILWDKGFKFPIDTLENGQM